MRRLLAILHFLVFLIGTAPAKLSAQAWVPATDAALRMAVERLVDDHIVEIPLLAWPLPRAELASAVQAARSHPNLSEAQSVALSRIERALSPPRREWFAAAGAPSALRGFEDAPRENAEAGVAVRWQGEGALSAELQARVAIDPVDGQQLRPDGSYLAAATGNWLWSGGWQDRWWGGGYDGSLELSSNARPVFALSLDRQRSMPFETRWLSWLGPWTVGSFMGALEGSRPDSNHALLWGFRAAARPLPGLEISLTRNAQFCGDKPPCSPRAFWNVVSGNDNAGENVAAADEPGNQLATYEAKWSGRIGRLPFGIYVQRTGETIDNKFPRPLRSLNLVSLSTWGAAGDGDSWKVHVELSSTTVADLDDARIGDVAYENSVFTAGYRYRGRVLGHSTDSDSRQIVFGLSYDDSGGRSWSARLRRAEINRIGSVPQPNHLLSRGPALWWGGEATLTQPLLGGKIDLALGLERHEDESTRRDSLLGRGYLRWSQTF